MQIWPAQKLFSTEPTNPCIAGGTYKAYMKEYIEADVFEKTYTKQGAASAGASSLVLTK
jgi:hypothetical protein